MSKHVAGNATRTTAGLREEIARLTEENDQLAESFSGLARAALEFDERGWLPINMLPEKGVTLTEAQDVAETIRRQMNTNGVLKRGANLRASYVFGRGFKMSSGGDPLPPRFMSIVNEPVNQEVLFGEQACKRNEKSLFSDGNLFVRYDRSARRFSVIPFAEIAGVSVDPDDAAVALYVKRAYQRVTGTNPDGTPVYETTQVWYPTDYASTPFQARIGGVRVDRNSVVIDLRVNDDTGSRWGLPDGLPAAPWAWAYSEYLKDGSKLLKALAGIAWQVKSKTAKGGQNIVSKLGTNRDVARTAVTGSDVELSAMPRNNTVDLDTGRPLAAMAASAMEVSVDALLAGGQGSNIMTLDQSTLNAAYARQSYWKSFFERVLRVIGVREPSVKFNKIIVDPSYRNVQSLGQAWQTGLFNAEVIQAEYAEELGIEVSGSVPAGVLLPNNAESFASQGANTRPGADVTGGAEVGSMTNVATGQGRSGAGVGDLTNSDNTLRDIQDMPR